MAPFFKVVEHTFPGQHIREYPGGTKRSQEDVLQIAVKQYVPLETVDAIPEGAITILGVPGNGIPKVRPDVHVHGPAARTKSESQEAYEPLWDDLYAELRSRGVRVRGIWVADRSSQGASGVLNEEVQGDNGMLLLTSGLTGC